MSEEQTEPRPFETPVDEQPAAADDALAAGARGGDRARDSRGRTFTSVAALLLALLAMAVAAYSWWGYRQLTESGDRTAREAGSMAERVGADLRALEARVAALDEARAAARRMSEELAARGDASSARLSDLDRRLSAIQGASALDSRESWLRAEAEYYLSVANTELGLAGHWKNAITALELADRRLAELADPALGRVRELIAGEKLELASVRLADVDGLVFSLGRLAARVDELPLAEAAPGTLRNRGETLDETEPGLGRLWRGVKSALLGIVRVERRDEPVARALSEDERVLTRRELALELQLAQDAALRAQPAAFRGGIQAAVALLSRDFDTRAAEVAEAVALLTGMSEIDVAPERPDISASLALLRTLPAAGAD